MGLSIEHETWLLLFRNRPTLALELLRDTLGVAVQAGEPAQIESADLTQAKPAEYHADFVVRYRGGSRPVVVVVEVQRKRDANKRYSWPVYVTLLRARFRCQVWLLVVAPNPGVARWCKEPIPIGNGANFIPEVLSAEAIPVLTDRTRARAEPELSILSVLAHGRGDPGQAVAVARASLASLEGLEAERAVVYFDLIHAALGHAARKAIDAMISEGYKFKSQFAKRYIAEGLAEGEAKGEARGEARAVIAVLEARGLSLTDEERAQIQGCADLGRLDSWVRRAVHVERAGELFERDG